MSILNAAIDEEGEVDFKKIHSIEGVYLTNIYDENYIQKSLTQGIENSQNKGNKSVNLDDYR